MVALDAIGECGKIFAQPEGRGLGAGSDIAKDQRRPVLFDQPAELADPVLGVLGDLEVARADLPVTIPDLEDALAACRGMWVNVEWRAGTLLADVKELRVEVGYLPVGDAGWFGIDFLRVYRSQ